MQEQKDHKEYIVFYFDGACEPTNPRGNMGVGGFILDYDRTLLLEFSDYFDARELLYETSNNVAEYLALIKGLEYLIWKGKSLEHIMIVGDSKLVINQMAQTWRCKGGIYEPYYRKALSLVKKFDTMSFMWIPREKNSRADDLSKKAMIINNCEFRIQKI